MNLFQLVTKQMRQRSLSTSLTLLSVLLGVGLAVAIMILRREGQNLFAQTDFGYDVLIGPPKGSPLQLTLNTVYHMDVSPGVIPYSIYEDMARRSPALPGHPDYRPYVRLAVPFMVGDSFHGRRIIGTSPQMFGLDDQGAPAAHQFEYPRTATSSPKANALLPENLKPSSAVTSPKRLHLHLYDDEAGPKRAKKNGGAFAPPRHAGPNDKPDIHKPLAIVGILRPPTPPATASCSSLHQPLRHRRARRGHDRSDSDEGQHQSLASA
jgi:hypothetical protein